MDTAVRRATADDAADVGRLLDDFQTEFEEPTPGAEAIAERFPRLLAGGDTTVLLGGPGPNGLAIVRYRWQILTDSAEAYLAELYVEPASRGHGLGRALLDAALADARERGARWMDVATSEDDTAARGLYESAGFSNREGRPDGPVMLVYEREL